MNTQDIQLETPAVNLFSDIAERAAEAITNNGNASSQIRKFYDELVLWHDKILIPSLTPEQQQEKLMQSLPFIKMMKAKVAYAYGRRNVSKDFKDIFNQMIDQIKDASSLRNAKLFFEAVIGFSKEQSLKQNRS